MKWLLKFIFGALLCLSLISNPRVDGYEYEYQMLPGIRFEGPTRFNGTWGWRGRFSTCQFQCEDVIFCWTWTWIMSTGECLLRGVLEGQKMTCDEDAISGFKVDKKNDCYPINNVQLELVPIASIEINHRPAWEWCCKHCNCRESCHSWALTGSNCTFYDLNQTITGKITCPSSGLGKTMGIKSIYWPLVNVPTRSTIYLPLLGPHRSCRDVKAWLDCVNSQLARNLDKSTSADFRRKNNLTEENSEKAVEAATNLEKFRSKSIPQAKQMLEKCSDVTYSQRRMLSQLSHKASLRSPDDVTKYLKLKNNMTTLYGDHKICPWESDDCSKKLSLEPDMSNIMFESKNFDEMQYVFEKWHELGKKMKPIYKDYMELVNKGARENGFADLGAFWRSKYEIPNFDKELEKILYDLLPLYEQLHAYVRRKLMGKFPGKFKGPGIPAHILGNMWAQEWPALTPDLGNGMEKTVDEAMKQQKYTPKRMVEKAEEFFRSLGMKELPPSFWKRSMFAKPKDAQVICHAVAADFSNGEVAISMCMETNLYDFVVINHEMGHIHYFLQYNDQPVIFQNAANLAFHEALGDTISFAVSTPKHLKKLGLLPEDWKVTNATVTSLLMDQALKRVTFMPFAFILDKIRWEMFNESVSYDDWNKRWWELRFQFQGIVPMTNRDSSDLFDIGGKFHVPGGYSYSRYLLSYVFQFQFYKALCDLSGHRGPLHSCSFYGSEKAGKHLIEMMNMGSSKPWPEALQVLTGTRSFSVEAMKAYFAPLMDWLAKENEGACFGWGYRWPDEVMKTLPKNRC